MLEALLGNKSVEKVLLFLLVNERCYATELQNRLNTALSPIQKALLRLERGHVLVSRLEGKVRSYQFNEEYPFLIELQNLLKEAYLRLSPKEKALYSTSTYFSGENQRILSMFWKELKEMDRITFVARALPSRTFLGKGEGKVEREFDGKATLIFHESGALLGQDENTFNFKNAFRWTYLPLEGIISLEHLRHGKENPVFLFQLVPRGEHLLESCHAHLCSKDAYFGLLRRKKGGLTLTFRVLGPKKNEEIEYTYSKTQGGEITPSR